METDIVSHSNRERPASDLLPGRYRHYKGNEYVVLGVARHSEIEQDVVVYRQDYGERGLWVRPKQMFQEMVKVDGEAVPRFEYLGPATGATPESL